MSDFITTKTKTEKTYVIRCEICGARVDELTEAGALHMAEQTGRVLEGQNGRRVWYCDACRDHPETKLYKEPTRTPRPTAAELAIIAGYLETIQDGGQLSAGTLDRLRALGYVYNDPPAVTVAGKSLIETYRAKRAGQ